MIACFENENAFLSNFYDSPFSIEGINYPTVEHFFQAQKTLDYDERRQVAAQPTPGRAKRMGRQVKLRPDWESVKDKIMYQGVKIKFSDPELRQWLLDTGNEELVEGNWWGDRYWGVCEGVGKNHLGKILMKVREELR